MNAPGLPSATPRAAAQPGGSLPIAPAAAPPPATLDPYRVFFPLGAAYAIAGTVPWVVVAITGQGWPGPLHRALMMEGFETSFVLGFLLTAIPAFTHGARCRPWELIVALALELAFGAFAFAGFEAAAHAAFVAVLLWLAVAVARRVGGARLAPPEEFLFIGVGLVLGLAGGVMELGASLGAWTEPAPRLGSHLVSLGMVLGLVLGVGTLLVPVFAGMRDPLVLPGVAGPHERERRRQLYMVLAALLGLSFAADGAGVPWLGGATRLAVAACLGLLGWKLGRRPGRAAIAAWVMWASGWMVLAGLALAAAFPLRAVAFHHLSFIGGYGLLTLAIGTRVVTGHGRFPVTDESRLLNVWVVTLVALALVLRIAAEFAPPAPHLLAGSAALWIAAWLVWSLRAVPRITSPARPTLPGAPAPAAGPLPRP